MQIKYLIHATPGNRRGFWEERKTVGDMGKGLVDRLLKRRQRSGAEGKVLHAQLNLIGTLREKRLRQQKVNQMSLELQSNYILFLISTVCFEFTFLGSYNRL